MHRWISLIVVLSALVACSTRVSLGALPDDERTTTDETAPDPSSGSSASPTPALAPDASSPVDAWPAPDEDASAEDAGKAPYFPCGGKACGDLCRICPPGDPNCFETMVVKQCDKTGVCTPSPSSC